MCVAKILCQFHLCTASNRKSREYICFDKICFHTCETPTIPHPVLIVYCLLCALHNANNANDCSWALAVWVLVLAHSHQHDKIKTSRSKCTQTRTPEHRQHGITGLIINSAVFQRIEKCVCTQQQRIYNNGQCELNNNNMDIRNGVCVRLFHHFELLKVSGMHYSIMILVLVSAVAYAIISAFLCFISFLTFIQLSAFCTRTQIEHTTTRHKVLLIDRT